MKNKNYNYLLNQKQNMLTATNIVKVFGKRKPNQYSTMIECKCDCGNTTLLYPYLFENKKVISCGCLRHIPRKTIHNLSKENLYSIWESMRLRCNSPKRSKYEYYGARGIKVCDEWQNNYLAFREWSLNNGYAPKLTLDRINTDGNYEPSNCRWVNRKTQQRNRRNCIYITYNGKTQCLIEWCEELNLNYKTIHKRIVSGWDKIEAITVPVKSSKINH